MSRSREQQLTLARVARERGCTFEFVTRLVSSSELVQQIAADAWQQVIVLQRRFSAKAVDRVEARLGSSGHADGDGAVQVDDRRRRHVSQLVVERHDPVPIGRVSFERAGMTGGDRRLQQLRSARNTKTLGARDRRQPALNQQPIPQGAVLIEQQDRLTRHVHSRA